MEATKVKTRVEEGWVGGYRLSYDGKAVSIFGNHKNYPMWGYGLDNEGKDDKGIQHYDEVCLVGCLFEGRNLTPTIDSFDNEWVIIDLGGKHSITDDPDTFFYS